MKNIFSSLTSFFSSNRDAANLRMLAAGRIPIMMDVSAQMLRRWIPTSTDNQNGYLIGEDLIDCFQENQAMQLNYRLAIKTMLCWKALGIRQNRLWYPILKRMQTINIGNYYANRHSETITIEVINLAFITF